MPMAIPLANHQNHLVLRHQSVDFKTYAFRVKQRKKNVGKNSKGENSKKVRKK